MGWEAAPMSIPSGPEGAAKAWYGLFVSLENQLTDHVSSLSLSWQIP